MYIYGSRSPFRRSWAAEKGTVAPSSVAVASRFIAFADRRRATAPASSASGTGQPTGRQDDVSGQRLALFHRQFHRQCELAAFAVALLLAHRAGAAGVAPRATDSPVLIGLAQDGRTFTILCESRFGGCGKQ